MACTHVIKIDPGCSGPLNSQEWMISTTFTARGPSRSRKVSDTDRALGGWDLVLYYSSLALLGVLSRAGLGTLKLKAVDPTRDWELSGPLQHGSISIA